MTYLEKLVGRQPALMVTLSALPLTATMVGCGNLPFFGKPQHTLEAPSAPYVDYTSRKDFASMRGDPEELNVVFLLHPRCALRAQSSGASDADPVRIFRHVAVNVLLEVFRSAIEISSEDDLKEIETYRDLVLGSGRKPHWLLDPAVLIIIDFREPSTPALAGQLHLRLLDLRLARELGLSYDTLERDLYSKRALVCEGYQEVGAWRTPEQTVLELWHAWGKLLDEVLEQPRYLVYRNALRRLARGDDGAHTEEAEPEETLRLLFFGEVPETRRPYQVATGTDGYEERVREIESRLLFGRSPAQVALVEDPSPEVPDDRVRNGAPDEVTTDLSEPSVDLPRETTIPPVVLPAHEELDSGLRGPSSAEDGVPPSEKEDLEEPGSLQDGLSYPHLLPDVEEDSSP